MIPPTPVEICRCVVKAPRHGLNGANGYGETRCATCKKHIAWGHGVPLSGSRKESPLAAR